MRRGRVCTEKGTAGESRCRKATGSKRTFPHDSRLPNSRKSPPLRLYARRGGFCMKRRNNRFLAGTLAGLMMLTMLPVTALAAENDTADGTTTLTAESIAPVSETLNSSTANVVNDDKAAQLKKPSRMTARTSRATEALIRGKTPTVILPPTTTAKAARTAQLKKTSRMTARTSRATAAPIRRETPTVILPPTTTAKAARTTRLPRRLPRKSAIRSMRRLMQQSTLHRTAIRLRLVRIAR